MTTTKNPAAKNPITFNVGDTVTWASQAAGSTKAKLGVIVRVIDPGQYISRSSLFQLGRTHNISNLVGRGQPRSHRSYLVSVTTSVRKQRPGKPACAVTAQPKIYWPVVSLLRPAPEWMQPSHAQARAPGHAPGEE